MITPQRNVQARAGNRGLGNVLIGTGQTVGSYRWALFALSRFVNLLVRPSVVLLDTNFSQRQLLAGESKTVARHNASYPRLGAS